MMKLMIEAVRFTARTKTFIMSSKVTFIFSLHKALPPFPRTTAGRGYYSTITQSLAAMSACDASQPT